MTIDQLTIVHKKRNNYAAQVQTLYNSKFESTVKSEKDVNKLKRVFHKKKVIKR